MQVLTAAITTRILFEDEKQNGTLVAFGVEFVYSDGNAYVAHARKEIISSAGYVASLLNRLIASVIEIKTVNPIRTIKTPQLLELSGIGRKEVLQKIGVPLKIELPGVGENVQDHLVLGTSHFHSTFPVR